jgi:hypothetical protein
MNNPGQSGVDLPKRIAALPVDPERGYPIPFFVASIDGKPDFRIADAAKVKLCREDKLCWICGQKLGRFMTFVIGPMCAVNLISAEPPMHRECAEFSLRVCPFLLNPNQKRNPKKIEGQALDELPPMPGIAIMRNPGVMLEWITTSYRLVLDHHGQLLFSLGEPTWAYWWTQGRTATRAEVLESIESGLPILRELAAEDGPKAERALERQIVAAVKLLPLEHEEAPY